MTEPLMLAPCSSSCCGCTNGSGRDRGPAASAAALPSRLAVAMFAAAWTRYEAWLIIAAAALIAAFAVATGNRPSARRRPGAPCRSGQQQQCAVRSSTAGSPPVNGSSPAGSTKSTRRTTASAQVADCRVVGHPPAERLRGRERRARDGDVADRPALAGAPTLPPDSAGAV